MELLDKGTRSMDKVSILLVDDNPNNLLALETILEPLGEALVRAYSGEEVLRYVLEQDFAVILLDVQLPGLSGIDTARLIKERARSHATPIIFLTALDTSNEDVLNGYAAGAVDYLVKPLIPEVLRMKVSTFVELFRKNSQLQSQLEENQRLHQYIDKRRQMEEILSQRSHWLHTTLTSIGDAVIATDPEGRIAFLNPVGEKLTGWSEAEAIGQEIEQVFNIINEHTRRPIQNPIWQALREGVPVDLVNHTMLIAKDGREIPIDDSSAPIQDESGQVAGAILVFRDVTQQKTAYQLQSQLAAIIKSSDDAIISKDLNGVITSWNQGAQQMYGYTAEEVIGKSISVLIPPDWTNDVPHILARIRQGERVIHYETKRITKDGKVLDVSLTVSPIHDEEGNVIGASKIARDITGQNTLQRLQAQLAAIVESSDDAIISKDLNGVITSWNRGAKQLYGYTAEEIIGQPVEVLIPADWPNDVPQILARISQGERVVRYETKRITKDGKVLDVSLTVSPIYDAAGNVIGASKIARDITERKQREEELARLLLSEQQARAQAEEAVRSRNEFLSVASHELKTPVTSMRGFAQLLMQQLNRNGTLEPERLHHGLSRIEEQAIKLTVLINQLLDISRIDAGRLILEISQTNLTALVQQVVDQAQGNSLRHIFSLQAPPALNVSVDPIRLEQVITNLLDNASKYSPDGGAIDVEIMQPDAHSICLSVTDQGVGIPIERRERLFERFYQAHQEGYAGGMGLGLYISKQIVELHGGTLRAEFPDEGGTRFVILLPQKV
jgi:two-component system sensor histidine kinase VicK